MSSNNQCGAPTTKNKPCLKPRAKGLTTCHLHISKQEDDDTMFFELTEREFTIVKEYGKKLLDTWGYWGLIEENGEKVHVNFERETHDNGDATPLQSQTDILFRNLWYVLKEEKTQRKMFRRDVYGKISYSRNWAECKLDPSMITASQNLLQDYLKKVVYAKHIGFSLPISIHLSDFISNLDKFWDPTPGLLVLLRAAQSLQKFGQKKYDDAYNILQHLAMELELNEKKDISITLSVKRVHPRNK